MLLILGTVGVGSMLGWSLSNFALSLRSLYFTLIAITAAALEIKAIRHQASLVPFSAALVVAFAVHLLVVSFLRARVTELAPR